MKALWFVLCVGVALLVVLMTSCSTAHSVIVNTGTVLGLAVAENPSSGLYEARLGYARTEFAYVPSNRSVQTNGAVTGAPEVANVLMEIRMENLFKGGLVYQRLAVGDEAVRQPGAVLLFAKNVSGNLDAQVLAALQGVPTVERSVLEAQAPLARAFGAAADKTPFNEVAVRHGYRDFAAFVLDHHVTLAKVNALATELKGLGLSP
jgi:hypothetical protein